jgi:hypothetical protein
LVSLHQARIIAECANQESRVFAEHSVGEDQQEFGAIGIVAGGLEGMGDTRREVPEVTGALGTMPRMVSIPNASGNEEGNKEDVQQWR